MIPQRIILGYSGSSSALYSYALFTWGYGAGGQLGQNDLVSHSVPTQVGVQTDWTQVSIASTNQTLAIKSNGTLWAWGENSILGSSAGVLGLGDVVDRSSPVQVGTLTDWSQVVMGGSKTGSFAIKTDGTLWSWGTQPYGSLGQGDVVARSSPTQVGTLTNWSQVSSAWKSVVAIKTDGTLWAWGFGTSGELGDGTVVSKSSPVQIGNLTDWSKVSTGYRVKLAIKTDGTLWSWGANTTGVLGDGTVVSKSSPIQIGSLTTWSSIASGVWFSVATKTDGTVWAWGQGSNGVLGLNNVTDYSSPVQVGTLTDWSNIQPNTGGNSPRAPHIVKTDGTLWGWGQQWKGTIGDNADVNRSSPVQIGGATDWYFSTNGSNHAAGIRKIDNNAGYTLWAWGENTQGQLGDGTVVSKSSPIQIGSLNDWTVVTTHWKGWHGIKTDGTLWGCGDAGTTGMLGDGTVVDKSSPVQIGNLSDWSQINHVHAIKTDGTLWGWGANSGGRLGDGTIIDKSSPVQIGALTTWSKIKGGSTPLAIKTDGTLWAWGRGNNGALGDGTVVDKSSPIQIGTLTTWNKISRGLGVAFAIKTDGTLWTWGDNLTGALGLGNTTNYSSPIQVGTLTDWAQVEALYRRSIAIKTDGTLWTWGKNTQGQLGDGTVVDKSSPIQVGTLTDWSTIIKNYGGSNYAPLVLKTDGTLWNWGAGTYGKLGRRNTTNYSSPVQLGSGAGWYGGASSGVFQIGLRRPTIAAGTTTGYFFICGDNYPQGQLGDSTVVSKSSPIQVGTDIWKSVGSGQSSIGVKTNGTLWTWGNADDGQLGNNTITPKLSSPIQVGALTNWSQVTAGGNRMHAIKTDGTLWAWGANGTYGRLGTNNTTNYSSPVQVGALTNWAYVTTGFGGSSALKTDGTLWGWGFNTRGQLGLGDAVNKSSPIQVGALTNWSKISSGSQWRMALKTDGTLWTWGANTQGQLGDGTVVDESSPVQIGTLTTWADVHAGSFHGLAIKTDGTLWIWGRNNVGQLGLNNTTYYSSPVQVGSLTDWGKVSGIGHFSSGSSFAIKTDGTLWSWGKNADGQLSLGDVVDRSSPCQVGHHTDWHIAGGDSYDFVGIRKAYQ